MFTCEHIDQEWDPISSALICRTCSMVLEEQKMVGEAVWLNPPNPVKIYSAQHYFYTKLQILNGERDWEIIDPFFNREIHRIVPDTENLQWNAIYKKMQALGLQKWFHWIPRVFKIRLHVEMDGWELFYECSQRKTQKNNINCFFIVYKYFQRTQPQMAKWVPLKLTAQTLKKLEKQWAIIFPPPPILSQVPTNPQKS